MAVLSIIGPAIQVVKFIAKPILRQFNYLCCFTTNIKGLEAEAKKLDDALVGLEGQVQSGRENLQEPVPTVQTWLDESKEIKDKINEILNDASNVESGCLKVVARFSLSKKAKETTDRTKELQGQCKFDSIFQPCRPVATQTVPGGKTYDFESRKTIEEDIMTTLRYRDVNLIGIYGMGGLGKTTMAQKIRNRVLNENVFHEVAMTVVSQQADKSKIQVEIGGQLGLELSGETSQARVQKLHARLSGTKRILVILDDVWEGIELENLGIPCDSKGCTILITSRNNDALSTMGFNVENKIFGMEILSEEEAWYLFREGAGTCVDDDTNLNSIAKEVVKECKGLPIALKALGLALKDKNNASIWNNALRELKQCDADIPNYIKEVYTPLILSYDFLDSEKAKSLFLLCCLFPEDYNIPLEELTYFCMGLGIFGGIINVEDARNKTCSLIDFLKSRSLLLDSDRIDHVRMHDVVRDVCIFISKREGCIGGNNCSWISSSQLLGERNELLTESRFPNLRILSLSSPREESKFGSAFLEGIKELYVLCIKSYQKLTSLPHTTQSLINLKTLLLDSCRILKSISVVGKLRNLEILICRGCGSIEELPPEMKGLNQLKLLELTACHGLKCIGRGIISSLVGLEELKMHKSFDKWEAEDREERENAGLGELEALTNLRCLEIEIDDPALAAQNMQLSSMLKKFNIKIRARYELSPIVESHHKKMYLRLEGESCLGDRIEMKLLRDTEGLYLSGNGANNVDLAKCQNIQSLELRECKTMKSIIRTSILVDDDDATPFPLIQNLILKTLPKLEEIWNGPISSNSFRKLKTLTITNVGIKQFWKSSSQNNYVPLFSNLSSIEISYCRRLRNLGQLSMAGKDCLPQLETLRILNCEMMEQVFLWNDKETGENEGSIENRQNRHVITKVFPKLKEVELYNLPNLTTFYQGIEGIEFPLLREMKIYECPKMKNIIIGSNENSSREITSSSADIDAYLHLFCQSEKVSFGSLEVLEINHNPFCGHEIPSSLFNGLEELTINEYKGSTSLFTLSMARNLVSLRELSIRNCDEMIKAIEDEQQVVSGGERIPLFPKLEKLELAYLPKLVSFCDWKCEVELPLLFKVEITDCPNMENLRLGLVATPKLEAFTTNLTTYVGVGVDVAFNSLKELAIIWNKNPLYDHKISVSLFNGLEKLRFYRCNGSMSLFSSSAVGNLVNLRVLYIGHDDMLVKAIEDNEEKEDGKLVSGGQIRTVVFPKLEELRLYWLPKLVRFCEWKCDVELPSLTKVHIYKCPNMENFSMGLVTAPNLKFVEIDYKEIGATKDLNGALQQRNIACLEKERIRRMERKVVTSRKKERMKGGEENQN